MKGKNRGLKGRIISTVFLIVLFVITYILLFERFKFNDIIKVLEKADAVYLPLGLSMVLIYMFCYGRVMKGILSSNGSKCTLWQSIVYGATDFYFSAVTPSATGGQPMVIYYMSKNGVPVYTGTFATILHTVLFKIVLLLFNVVLFVLQFNVWWESGWVFILLWALGVTIQSMMVLFAFMSMFGRKAVTSFCRFFIRLGTKLRIVKDYDSMMERFGVALDDYQKAAVELKQKKKLVIKMFFWVVIQRLAYFSVAYIVYLSFDKAETHGYIYFLAMQVFIALAVDSLPLPGGMGANELAIIDRYENTFGADQAAGAMLLIRFVNFYFGLIVSAVIVFINYIYHSFLKKPLK